MKLPQAGKARGMSEGGSQADYNYLNNSRKKLAERRAKSKASSAVAVNWVKIINSAATIVPKASSFAAPAGLVMGSGSMNRAKNHGTRKIEY